MTANLLEQAKEFASLFASNNDEYLRILKILEPMLTRVQAAARLEEFDLIRRERPLDPSYWDIHHRAALTQAAHPAPAPQTSARPVCDTPNEDGSYRCNKEPHTSGDHVHSFINPDGQRDIYWWPAHLSAGEGQPKLSDEEILEIQEGLADIAAGRTKSIEQIRAELASEPSQSNAIPKPRGQLGEGEQWK